MKNKKTIIITSIIILTLFLSWLTIVGIFDRQVIGVLFGICCGVFGVYSVNILNKEMNTNPSQLDEEQLNKRNKFGYNTFLITSYLIFINYFIKIFYSQWATPLVELAFLGIVPLFYYTSKCVFNDISLFRKNAEEPAFFLMVSVTLLFDIILLFNFFGSTHHLELISNGMLSDGFGTILTVIFLNYLCVICWIKRRTILKISK